MASDEQRVLRPIGQRPSLGQLVRRSVAAVPVGTVSLVLSAWLLDGFTIDTYSAVRRPDLRDLPG
jgi:hypothetical protein